MSLPSGYKQINYIQSTASTQYITLPTFTCDKWEIECEILNNIDSEQCILGNRDNGSADRWELYADNNAYRNYTLYNSGGNCASTIPYYKHAIIEYDDRYESFTVNGHLYGPQGLSSQPKYIFQYGDGYYPAKGRVYSFKAWNSNSLVISLTPCIRLSDGKPGMYDTVNNIFLTNGSSSNFTAGPDADPVPQFFQIRYNGEIYYNLNLNGDRFGTASNKYSRNLSDYVSMSETIEYDWYDVRIFNNTGQPISVVGELLIDDSNGETTHVNVNVQFDTIEQFYDLSYESGTGCNISDVYYRLVFKSLGFNDYIKEYNWE